MARPKKEVDPEKVRKLAGMGLSIEEIGATLDCSVRTLHRRFGTVIKEGWKRRNASLRRCQFKAATGGNVAMMIWLGKQYLGQKEQITIPSVAPDRPRLLIPDDDRRYEEAEG